MLERCLLGAVLVAASVSVVTGQEMKRTELKRADLTGVPGMEVIISVVEVPPGVTIPRHFHHGDEALYVLEGAMVQAPGREPTNFATGTAVHIARDVPHGGSKVTGDRPLKLLNVHIIDKGKPLSEIVQ